MKRCSLYNDSIVEPLQGYCAKNTYALRMQCQGRFAECDSLGDPEVKGLVAESMAEEISKLLPNDGKKEEVATKISDALPRCISTIHFHTSMKDTIDWNSFEMKQLIFSASGIVEKAIGQSLPRLGQPGYERTFELVDGIRDILRDYSPVILKMHT